MDVIKLAGTNISTSRLGFGCSGLMGRLGMRESRRLIDAARDAGIKHFDTARMYGYGDAEKALAKILATSRMNVTVTTKAGIVPPQKSLPFSIAKNIARKVVKIRPELRMMFRQKAETKVVTRSFDPALVMKSIETSLRELNSEFIDILLLHECLPADLEQTELLLVLDQLVESGKVRQYGIATSIEHTQRCVGALRLNQVVQIASDAVNRNVEIMAFEGHPIITHSALGPNFINFCAKITENDLSKSRWSNLLDFDVTDRRRLGHLFLRCAMDANPQGIVLFSSSNVDTILGNVRAMEQVEILDTAQRLKMALHEGIYND